MGLARYHRGSRKTKMAEQLHVLVIDDHPLFREGLKSLLAGLAPNARVSQAASVTDALAMAQAGPDAPTLVLMDWFMPGPHGLQALAQVRTHFADVPVVVVSGEEAPETIREAIQHGAAGFIPKSTDPSVTVQALRLVLSQGVYLPPAALQLAPENKLDARRTDSPFGTHATQFASSLSPRQLSVLRCLLQGKANKVIAREIGIAEGTVKAHLWSVYQLLGVSNRAQAMYRAHEMGLFGHLASNETSTQT
jgi:DNA-binding NarL/FixJ family response regulator